jgi:hypothetical protein
MFRTRQLIETAADVERMPGILGVTPASLNLGDPGTLLYSRHRWCEVIDRTGDNYTRRVIHLSLVTNSRV